MKKVGILLSAAVAGLLAFSCSKEVNQETVQPVESAIHFKVLAHGGVDTRTSVLQDESFVKWDANDGLKIVETLTYTLSGETNTQNNSGSAGVTNLQDDGKKADFDAVVVGNPPVGSTVVSASYVAAYPYGIHLGTDEEQSNLDQGGQSPNKFWRVNMPAVQYPGEGTFDPDADILLSAPASKDDNSRVEEGEVLSFSFHRIGTAVRMTVKGLTPGEKLQKIVITAPVDIVGYVKVDLTSGDYLEGVAEPYAQNSHVLTLKFNDLTITNDDLIVWFRVLPTEWEGTLEMTAETDGATYYRTTAKESAITLTTPMVFADAGLTKFKVNMGTVRVPKDNGTAYTLVTNQAEIGEGATYIVAYVPEAAATATVMGPITGTNHYASYVEDVAYANNTITIQNETIQEVTFEPALNSGEFYVKFGDQYLYCSTSSNNKLSLSDEKLTGDNAGKDIWQVTPTGIINTVVKNNNNVYFRIQYNTTSGQQRFSNYPNTQKDINLFKNGEVQVIPAIIPSTTSLEAVSYKGGDFDDLTFSLMNLDGETVVVTCDGTVVTEAIAVDGTVAYTVSPNATDEDREGWIKIAAGDVDVTVTVQQAAMPPIEIILEGVTDGKIYVGPGLNDEVTFTVQSNYHWDTDYEWNDPDDNPTFSVNPTTGNLDEDESNVTEVTITALRANVGDAPVLLGNMNVYDYATAEGLQNIEVWQTAPAATGDGSLAHPFTIAGVKAYIDANSGTGPDDVYVAGKISYVQYFYDATHETATYFISDDGTRTDEFEAYGVYFLENKRWVEGNSQIAVGDDVILFGKVLLYTNQNTNVSTYETSNKKAYLYSLNGVTSEIVPTITVSDITDVPAAGVTNQTATVVFENNSGWSASVTPDNTVVTAASISGTTVTYTVAANTGGARNGSIVVTLSKDDRSLSKTINVAQVAAEGQGTNWSTTYSSNVTLPVSGTNVSSCKVVISGVEYDGTKLGKSGSGASTTVTIPAGTTKLYVHCAAWKAKSASLSLSTDASGVTISPSSNWTLTSDTGISNNSPFTLGAPEKASTDYFNEYTLTGVNSSITVTIEAKNERAVFWGVNAE